MRCPRASCCPALQLPARFQRSWRPSEAAWVWLSFRKPGISSQPDVLQGNLRMGVRGQGRSMNEKVNELSNHGKQWWKREGSESSTVAPVWKFLSRKTVVETWGFSVLFLLLLPLFENFYNKKSKKWSKVLKKLPSIDSSQWISTIKLII